MNAYVASVLAFVLATGATVAAVEWAASGAGDLDDDDLALLAAASGAAAPRWDGAGALERPVWREGFAWGVFFERSNTGCAFVVGEASDDGYHQGVACRNAEQLAVEDAIYSHEFMGRFDADLAGVANDEDDEPTRWFDWPLVDGKTWETQLEGYDVEVVATAVDAVEGPLGAERGFELVMTLEGETLAAYNFVPSVAWWSELRYPKSGWSMRITSFERQFEGEAVEATAAPLLDQRAAFLALFPRTFEVDDEYDVLRFYRDYGGTFGGRIELRTPEGDTAYSETNGLNGGSPVIEYFPGEEGVWELDATGFTTGVLRIQVHGIVFEYFEHHSL